jgi:PIN domain nuclease of toxin-antitoxin system
MGMIVCTWSGRGGRGADTHTALWYLYDDARLSVAAGDFIDQAGASGRPILVASAIADPDHAFEEAPFAVEIVEGMRQVPRAGVRDMPDRIVAATGVYFGVPVISRDGRIRAANVQTVW